MSDRLILASKSPRRQALLASLGLAFAVDFAGVDETPLPGEAPAAMVCRLCRTKARAAAATNPGATILAADTVVALEGTLLGKPADAAEAVSMLRALRGRTHQVYTAVCVARDGALKSQLSISHVTMRSYSDEEISAYVDSGDPLDKAGAYAIQHPHFSPVTTWEGCYAAVMGLPLRLAADLLVGTGVAVPADVAGICERMSKSSCCARMVQALDLCDPGTP